MASLIRLAGIALILAVPAAALAHAFLERAEPRAGSVLRAAPAEVRLWFTGSLEPAFSAFRVVDERGERVDLGDTRVDPASPALLRASVGALPPGIYRVIWRVLALDGHVSEGEFTFRIAP